jgi:membrane associated rhomboid family serine protease
MMDEPKQPAIKAPWPAVLLVLAIVVAYLVQSTWINEQALILNYGFAPVMLSEGHYLPLVTSMFLHGGWTHAGMNALGAMAFGAPTARLLGLGYQSAQGRAPILGGLAFLLFFLLCGVLGSLGYGLVHRDGQAILIGASGGVAGLMGAASRMIDRPVGLSPYGSPTVMGMAAAWIIVNLLMALIGLAPGAGGVAIAWEAHLFGYAAGLLLIGPAARIMRARTNNTIE